MAFFLRGECLSALSFFYPPPKATVFTLLSVTRFLF